MNPQGTRRLLLWALLAGGITAVVLPDSVNPLPAIALSMGACGLVQLINAVLLAHRAIAPGLTWGSSSRGQFLLGASALLMSALSFVGKSWHPVLAWGAAVACPLLFVVGMRLEQSARRQHGLL